MDEEEAASFAQLSVLVIAWRCLYAERTHSRIEDVPCNLKKALKRTILMLISRLKAYGYKWQKWVERNSGTSLPATIPLRHREKCLISQGPCGDFVIHPKILEFYSNLLK